MHGLRGGTLWVVVIVKSCVNKRAGSWLSAQEWTTNQKPGRQVDPALDVTTTHKFPPLVRRTAVWPDASSCSTLPVLPLSLNSSTGFGNIQIISLKPNHYINCNLHSISNSFQVTKKTYCTISRNLVWGWLCRLVWEAGRWGNRTIAGFRSFPRQDWSPVLFKAQSQLKYMFTPYIFMYAYMWIYLKWILAIITIKRKSLVPKVLENVQPLPSLEKMLIWFILKSPSTIKTRTTKYFLKKFLSRDNGKDVPHITMFLENIIVHQIEKFPLQGFCRFSTK